MPVSAMAVLPERVYFLPAIVAVSDLNCQKPSELSTGAPDHQRLIFDPNWIHLQAMSLPEAVMRSWSMKPKV